MLGNSLIKSRSMVHYKHPTPNNDSSKFGIEETSAFLKHQIGEIIKNELKAYHLRNKMQEDLEQYKKQQENQKLARTLIQDRMHDFREKQKNFGRRQYQFFQKRQKDREQKLKIFMAHKKGAHEMKCMRFNQSIGNVRERYFNISTEDSNMRLSKIVPNTAEGKRLHRSSRSSVRAVSISQSTSRVNAIKEVQSEQEKHKITNYLNKIQRSESKVILKQIQNEKRRQVSLKKKVKCLISQRKKMQEARMDKAEKEYKQKMEHFQTNLSRISQTKQIALMNKTTFNTRMRQKITEKRQHLHKEQIDRIVSNFSKGGKQNVMQEYRSALDLAYTHKNKSMNLLKMKLQENEADLQNNMRSLAQKIQKIKNIQYGEKLDDFTIKTILSMMDKNDPQYLRIAEFLKSERKGYIEGIVKKQEEKNKMKKMNKTMNKTSLS